MGSEQWSPEQIKGQADINGIPMVSHETIYKVIRNDKANVVTCTKIIATGSSIGHVLLEVKR